MSNSITTNNDTQMEPAGEIDDDLTVFSGQFFGKDEPVTNDSEDEEVVETEAEEDTLETEDEDEADKPEAEDEALDEEPEPEPEKKPKNRFQERITDLTNKNKATAQRADRLEAELAELKAQINQPKKPEPVVAPEKDTSPQPDAKNEDGTAKYQLGEFDPEYIRDLTRHTLQVERDAIKAQEAAEREQNKAQEERNQVVTQWGQKLEASTEKYPDITEKNLELRDALSDIDPQFGDYLALTIMDMEHGTDVLYHLGSNLKEAKAISKMNPTQATLALGRLEARFALQKEEQTKAHKLKVSKAPQPPERLNKGTAVTKAIPGDTDDLEAFKTAFFGTKSRGR